MLPVCVGVISSAVSPLCLTHATILLCSRQEGCGRPAGSGKEAETAGGQAASAAGEEATHRCSRACSSGCSRSRPCRTNGSRPGSTRVRYAAQSQKCTSTCLLLFADTITSVYSTMARLCCNRCSGGSGSSRAGRRYSSHTSSSTAEFSPGWRRGLAARRAPVDGVRAQHPP
jgi:hypothetical protein